MSAGFKITGLWAFSLPRCRNNDQDGGSRRQFIPCIGKSRQKVQKEHLLCTGQYEDSASRLLMQERSWFDKTQWKMITTLKAMQDQFYQVEAHQNFENQNAEQTDSSDVN